MIVNDGFAAFSQSNDDIGRLGGSTIDVQYPWIEGQAYELILLTATGATITHEIAAAVETPDADLGFYGLMALIGLYVGVIPVAIGMLWLPWVRGVDARWMRFLLAFTIGLLAFLGIDALLEAPSWPTADRVRSAGRRSSGSGPPARTWCWSPWTAGSARAARGSRTASRAAAGTGSATAPPSGRTRHRAPQPRRGARDRVRLRDRLARPGRGARRRLRDPQHDRGPRDRRSGRARGRARLDKLLLLGLLAGAPAVLGAWIGASAFHPSLAALMFGIGAGAIAQVIVQIAPQVRDEAAASSTRSPARGCSRACS